MLKKSDWLQKEGIHFLDFKKSLSEMTERCSGFLFYECPGASVSWIILAKTRKEENPLLLILDGLTDPHSLGSILRTADRPILVSSFPREKKKHRAVR